MIFFVVHTWEFLPYLRPYTPSLMILSLKHVSTEWEVKAKKKAMNLKNFFYCFLSVQVYFVSFHELAEVKKERKKNTSDGTGNSSEENGEQQQIINKIPIDGEAHACIHVEHSYLNIKEFSFTFQFSQINTIRLNWFNRTLFIEQQEWAKDRKNERTWSEAIGKGKKYNKKWILMFSEPKWRNEYINIGSFTNTHTRACKTEKVHKTYTWR